MKKRQLAPRKAQIIDDRLFAFLTLGDLRVIARGLQIIGKRQEYVDRPFTPEWMGFRRFYALHLDRIAARAVWQALTVVAKAKGKVRKGKDSQRARLLLSTFTKEDVDHWGENVNGAMLDLAALLRRVKEDPFSGRKIRDLLEWDIWAQKGGRRLTVRSNSNTVGAFFPEPLQGEDAGGQTGTA